MRRLSGHPRIDAWPGVIVASDEVGLGAWAGSLVVCAVAAPVGWDDHRVKDSKKLKIKAKREALYEEFFPDTRFTISLVEIPVDEIDRMGVGKALPYAHSTALQNVAKRLTSKPLAVVDGSLPVHRWELGLDIVALPKGDQLVPECALASILAKVTRDRMMTELDAQYPGYGFHSHCGYGAAAHEEALQRLGPCPAHRTSYDPIARRIAEREQEAQPKEAWTLLDDE